MIRYGRSLRSDRQRQYLRERPIGHYRRTGVALGIGVVSIATAMMDPWSLPALVLVCCGALLGLGASRLAATLLIATFPVLDFTPWAGQGVLRHHDFFLLGICAGWWRLRTLDPREGSCLAAVRSIPSLYTAWITVTAVIGTAFLLKWGDPFELVHLSSFNALRAAKGTWFAWLVFISFPGHGRYPDRTLRLVRSLAGGASAALIYIGLWCLAERTLVFGWTQWQSDYRIGGPMSGAMNVGGQAFEVCVILLLCLAIYTWRSASSIQRATIAVAVVLGLVALVLTLTRSALATVAGTLVVTVTLVLIQDNPQRRKSRWVLGAAVSIAVLAVGAFGVPAFRERIEGLPNAWESRTALYRTAVESSELQWWNWIVGAGSGSYPTLYRKHLADVVGKAPPASFSRAVLADKASAEESSALRIEGGTPSYLGTQVDHAVASSSLVRCRVYCRETAGFVVYLCEKNLFTSTHCRTATLRWSGPKPGSSDQWLWVQAPLKGELSGTTVQLGPVSVSPPLNLSIGTTKAGKSILVDQLQLLDESGEILWQEKNFQRGPRRWLMTTDEYWPFHVENLALHSLIEHGLIGLLLLVSVVVIALRNLYTRKLNQRAILAGLVFAPLLAGLVNSPIDTPEFVTLWLTPVFALAKIPAAADSW